jgi:hypothetical protein
MKNKVFPVFYFVLYMKYLTATEVDAKYPEYKNWFFIEHIVNGQILDWNTENCKDEWIRVYENLSPNGGFLFKNKEDAAKFKLFWG